MFKLGDKNSGLTHRVLPSCLGRVFKTPVFVNTGQARLIRTQLIRSST